MLYTCISLAVVYVCLYKNKTGPPSVRRIRRSIKNRKSQAKSSFLGATFSPHRATRTLADRCKDRGVEESSLSLWLVRDFPQLLIASLRVCRSVIYTTSASLKDTASISCLLAWWSSAGNWVWPTTSADYHMIVAVDAMNDRDSLGFPFGALKVAFRNNGASCFMVEDDNKSWPWTKVKPQPLHKERNTQANHLMGVGDQPNVCQGEKDRDEDD